jgi:hypothetical protein
MFLALYGLQNAPVCGWAARWQPPKAFEGIFAPEPAANCYWLNIYGSENKRTKLTSNPDRRFFPLSARFG